MKTYTPPKSTASKKHVLQLHLEDSDLHRLQALHGEQDAHIKHLENSFDVHIIGRGGHFEIYGKTLESTQKAHRVLQMLYNETAAKPHIDSHTLHLLITQNKQNAEPLKHGAEPNELQHIQLQRCLVKTRTKAQQHFIQAIRDNTITFGIGPAGTGKTYLAVAMAVDAFERHLVERIVLVRPAVEAGEKLGFLPGDLSQKVDPYLKPLYDHLHEMLGSETVLKLLERNVIEIAPLAYMRGRTLNRACVILDESQNTTIDQMKMFLTRLGYASKLILTGDITQVDLPKPKLSGLKHAMLILQHIPSVSFCTFEASDSVRHPLIESIAKAYEANPPHDAKPYEPHDL